MHTARQLALLASSACRRCPESRVCSRLVEALEALSESLTDETMEEWAEGALLSALSRLWAEAVRDARSVGCISVAEELERIAAMLVDSQR